MLTYVWGFDSRFIGSQLTIDVILNHFLMSNAQLTAELLTETFDETIPASDENNICVPFKLISFTLSEDNCTHHADFSIALRIFSLVSEMLSPSLSEYFEP